jgi:segregation and condensation protein B
MTDGSMMSGSSPSESVEKTAPDDARFLEAMRIAEAMLFASAAQVSISDIAVRVPEDIDVSELMQRLQASYVGRGVHLVSVAGGWMFRTAPDLAYLLSRDVEEQRKLSRAAIETLSIVAYHQPVTRAEIEDIRGVTTSKGTLDTLMETGWVRMRGRRRSPGRPVTYGTTAAFLTHFGLERIDDLPGVDELKGAGFLDGGLPAGFAVPMASDSLLLADNEDALDDLFEPLSIDDNGNDPDDTADLT